jgi:hypothetical protein
MSFAADNLYALLPAVYRERDAAQGYPLRALLAVVGEQMAVLEDGLDQLYDDLFIETCADWVVPYIGALVGVTDAEASRAEVANTLAYRRRKGTAAVLEQLARDITGWPASVVEYFQRLATTQYLNHPRPEHRSVADIRDPRWLGTPFDTLPRTAEVRGIARHGRYNTPNLGLHLWRLRSFGVTLAPAQRIDDQRWRLDPLGRDLLLYNSPEPEREIAHLARPENVPLPLTCRLLHEHPDTYLGPGMSLDLVVDGVPVAPGPGQTWGDVLHACNLMDHAGGWANLPADRIAIDPELGRVAFPPRATPTEVRASWHTGFSAEIGGGEYPRQEGFATALGPVLRVPEDHAGIQSALDALATTGGVVEITDNGTYREAPVLRVPAGARIELRAAEGRRPLLALTGGDLTLFGGDNAEVSINGLLVAGGAVSVPASLDAQQNGLARLSLAHCTLAPLATVHDQAGPPPVRLVVEASCAVALYRSIAGALRVAETASLSLTDCIVDAGPDGLALAAAAARPAGTLDAQAATLIGQVHVLTLSAQDTVFLAVGGAVPVRVDRLQEGCVRFCYVPPGSRTPRCYRCVPATEADAGRLVPAYTSLVWGEPSYGQLSARCPLEIRAGAEDGGEMGAFHHLRQTLKAARLARGLPETLRLSLEAGLFFES